MVSVVDCLGDVGELRCYSVHIVLLYAVPQWCGDCADDLVESLWVCTRQVEQNILPFDTGQCLKLCHSFVCVQFVYFVYLFLYICTH